MQASASDRPPMRHNKALALDLRAQRAAMEPAAMLPEDLGYLR